MSEKENSVKKRKKKMITTLTVDRREVIDSTNIEEDCTHVESSPIKKQIDFTNHLNSDNGEHLKAKLISPKRDQGDGSSTPECSAPEVRISQAKTMNPFKVNIEVDLMALILLLAGLVTRMWRLEIPRSIVFDELHYGRFAAMYMQNTFFFDTNPPFGKQLIALAAYLAGFDGNYQFEKIGADYASSVPVFYLRFVPALCGSLVIPTVYYIVVELKMTQWSAALAACLVLFDNALLTQSRFILMESILIFFCAFAMLALIKFLKESHRSFSTKWWAWMILLSISSTSALCVKYVGAFTFLLVLFFVGREYWEMLVDIRIPSKILWKHGLARIAAFLVLPAIQYLVIFYIHLCILTKAGPYDNVMSSVFQASLEGGLAAITKGQPFDVAYGSQITLRHTQGQPCWLHSHPHVYPIRYPDKRGSSHQQQVSCYTFKDMNNWWIIKHPEREDMVVEDPPQPVKHGDIIQLVHGLTSRALNSHDVAAPMSPHNQEVSCYIDYNISMEAQNLWRVEIINRDDEGSIWHTIQSYVHFIHVNTSQALTITGKQLGEWGFNQLEVATDRILYQDSTMWNVEEHKYTKSKDEKERERDIGMSELIPMKPIHLGFFEKFWEVQVKMLTVTHDTVNEHVYMSDPLEWPLLDRGIAYWLSPKTNAQIHLMGNLVIWYAATLGISIYCGLIVFYLMRRQRAFYDIEEEDWQFFVKRGEFLVGGYMMHYLPYYFADRTLFLHHYLPALVFKMLVFSATLEHIYALLRKFSKIRKLMTLCIIIWLIAAVATFRKFTTLSYGYVALSAEEVKSLQWKDTWDFIIH